MKYKVLSVGQNYHIRGGSDRMMFQTNQILADHGHAVAVFAAQDARNQESVWSRYFPAAANFEKPALIDLARYVYSFPAARQMKKLLDDARPDIAHLHIYYGKLTTSILSPLKDAGIPIVQSLHEYKLICPVYTLVSKDKICEACQGRYFWRAIPRKCNRQSLARTLLSVTESYVSRWNGAVERVDHFIAVSDFVRQKVIQYGVPSDKVTTVCNVIDASGIQPNGLPGKYFLYFGRLERVKGLFTLLEAASSITEAPTYIVGEGSIKAELQKWIEERGLTHVKLLGFKTGAELHDIIRGSLCTILPAEWYEPWGLTILEGFAHGRPAIGGRIGGIPEIITDGADGLLFEAGNAEALREKMAWMAAHPLQAVEMGRAGRLKVERKFTPEIYYTQLMGVYRKAAGNS